MFRSNETGLLLAKWQDTKEVLLLSNCHKPETTEILKKTKTGEQERIDCPEAIAFYRKKIWVASIEQISIKVYMITTGNPQNGGKRFFIPVSTFAL